MSGESERLARIEAAIIAACEAKLAEGWSILRGITRLPIEKRCCALGAIDIPEGTGGYHPRGLSVGMHEWETHSFVSGFDFSNEKPHGVFEEMGVRVAKRFCA